MHSWCIRGRNLTVDRNSDRLSQNPAVWCHESRNARKLVQFLVVGRQTISGVCVNKFDVELVLFGDGQEDHGAGIALTGYQQLLQHVSTTFPYLEAIEFPERHCAI